MSKVTIHLPPATDNQIEYLGQRWHRTRAGRANRSAVIAEAVRRCYNRERPQSPPTQEEEQHGTPDTP